MLGGCRSSTPPISAARRNDASPTASPWTGPATPIVTGFTDSTTSRRQRGPSRRLLRRATIDAFVTKINPAGSGLVYSTYLGGSGDDRGLGIAVDGAGNAYVTGWTTSTNFPTLNAYQRITGNGDAFVTQLNATGSALLYSTYLGGSGDPANSASSGDDSALTLPWTARQRLRDRRDATRPTFLSSVLSSRSGAAAATPS